MITIKFRGLRTDGKGWVYGMLFHNNKIVTETVSYESTLVEKGSPCYKYEYINIIPETVGQFTGLHDKNGKEIYEGDILYNNDRKENCVVKYDEEKAMFIVEYLESKDKFTLWESISNLYYSVGNIYENQELLDKNLAD